MGRKMRRPRHEPPKVWHNPDLVQGPRRADGRGGASASPSDGNTDPPGSGNPSSTNPGSGEQRVTRVVARAASPLDPKAAERERLVDRLLAAEGRVAISRACDQLLTSEHEVPDDQSLYLQVLEHSDEGRVVWAIERLGDVLAREACKRHAVLDSRLRRLEELADEATTRAAAQALRRRIHNRPSDETPIPGAVESSRRALPSTASGAPDAPSDPTHDRASGDVDEAS